MSGRRAQATLPAVLMAVFAAASAWGHGELHDQIAGLTSAITLHPHDASLFFRRGELRRLHQEWTGAEDDYRRAASLDPKLTAVRLGRATMMLDCAHAAEAEKLASDYLAESPGQPDGLLVRARARAALGKTPEATSDYDAALKAMADPTPDVYLERAAFLDSAVPPRPEEALRGLDEGIRRLGPLLTLQQRAVELEVAAGRTTAALARVETVLKTQPDHLEWLALKWRLLVPTRRAEAIAQAKAAALAALAALPPRRRLLPAMADLQRRLQADDPTPPKAAGPPDP